ncbi:hypothetical protein MGYG_00271 [Nannizzia gypsea CBS 118893]|uniref:Uncharacterized protein n=1 Tax=Arthroderma gypseum (strain ATCC MYA-4604 / CBS 118893) TaxID=535722 RepID=E5QYD7_ARTGP|nr:hypothetical protein MGYG_00271 [Nannizzia gypsea CBS 118893]EFQ97229.1 hypothetical protein MGYG_00271 [Nannizzia gypsea CBS 118893]
MPSTQSGDRPMTPVKVRGKKRHRGDGSHATDKGRPGPISTRANSDGTGRLPIPSKDTIIKPKFRTQFATINKINSRRSSLQSLPTEILEQIFFDCLEINLLHVFPRLAFAVSNECIYSRITMLAIWKEPISKHHIGDKATDIELAGLELVDEAMDGAARPPLELGKKEIMKEFRPVGYRKLSRTEKARLQSQIFSCRWATLELISSCVVKCNELQQLLIHGYESQRNVPDLINILRALESNLLWSYPHSLDFKENTALRTSLHYHNIKTMVPYRMSQNAACIFSIPEKAIDKRPWTPRKLELFRLLRLLLYQGTNSVPNQPYPREVLHEGVHQAIIENRSGIVERLLELDEYCVRSIAFSFKGVPKNAGYDIPSEHFLTAIRYSTMPDMMKTLVRASAESLPFDSSEITQWALEREEPSSPFYKWLLELMVQLPSYQRRHSSRQSLFVCGMLNLSLQLGGSIKPHRYLRYDVTYEPYKEAWSEEPYAWPVGLFYLADEAPIDISVLQHQRS